MKKALTALCLLLPLLVFAQSSDSVLEVEFRDSNDTILVGLNDIKYVINDIDTQSVLVRYDRMTNYKVSTHIDSIQSWGNGLFVKFTDRTDGKTKLVATHFIREVREQSDGKAVILVTDLPFVFKTEESFDVLRGAFTAGNGSGSTVSGANVGDGQGIYKSTVGSVLQFYSLVGGDNTTLTLAGDSITIDVASPDSLPIGSTLIKNSGVLDVADGGIDTDQLANDAVTFDKFQNINTDRLLGRYSPSPGSIEEIGIGSGLSLSGGTLIATGGGSGSTVRYDAGNGCWVTATGLGASFTMAGGTGTLVVPDSVTILSAVIKGETSDLSSGNFTVVFDQDPGLSYNTNYTTMFPPTSFQVMNTSANLAGGPSTALPLIYDEGSSPQCQVVGVGSGDITLRVINLDVFSEWSINISF